MPVLDTHGQPMLKLNDFPEIGTLLNKNGERQRSAHNIDRSWLVPSSPIV